jgi:hypothetical protein
VWEWGDYLRGRAWEAKFLFEPPPRLFSMLALQARRQAAQQSLIALSCAGSVAGVGSIKRSFALDVLVTGGFSLWTVCAAQGNSL